jgi:flagellar motility protein MotE (MotC chaperone)
MATKEQIENLKANWRGDPCWDIEETEGFEEHKGELLAYRMDMEAKWAAEFQEELRVYANVIGLSDNLRLAQHIRDLNEKIEQLETLIQLKLP